MKNGNDITFLKQNEVKIVGVIESPLYISRTRGSSKLGSGVIQYYLYIPKELVNSKIYTEAYITLEGTKELQTGSKEYDDKIEEIKEKIENLAGVRKEERYTEIKEEAENKLKDAENKLNTEKENTKKEIEDAEIKIKDAKDKLENAKKEVTQNENKANTEFKQAQNKIDIAEKELKSRESEFNRNKENYSDNIKTLEDTISKLKTTSEGYTTLVKSKNELQGKIDLTLQAIENSSNDEERHTLSKQLSVMQSQMQTINSQISVIETEVKNQGSNITKIDETISNLTTQLNTAKTQFKNAESQINTAKTELKKQKQTLAKTKQSTNEKIGSAKKEITSGEKEIKENEQKLADAKKEADDKIKDAENKLQDAKDKINDIKRPDWYVLTRNENAGYVSYMQDTDRIANIGKVFPIVFFVVAALISLTSMTRMVEEQRVQIGTLKAIGYNKIQIASKYIIYAILATLIGSLIGVTIGFNLLPKIIFNIYKMMYSLPDIEAEFNLYYTITGTGIAILCTVGATIYSCIKELISMPAVLMRPKAPKMGKRVLLENVKFIWSRMKFTQKVTARNIFRYKKRFLMTIIGVCGCTALIVAGFGLRDSVSYMIPSQYGKIFKYNLTVGLKDSISREQIDKKLEEIVGYENIKEALKVKKQSVKIIKNDNNQDIQLVIPEDTNKFQDFIVLKPRKQEDRLIIQNDSIIITEKIANLLDIKQGDIIKIKDTDDVEFEVKVGDITENYLQHYIYMSQNLYEKLYGEKAKYNQLIINTNELTEAEEEILGKKILADKNSISSVEFTSTAKDLFSDVMDNMNFVVWILIISAGLLDFVVLYNLSNVNISERIRELASLKVLGFYNKEVYNYIAKETTILTIIGMILGLASGYFLNFFIMQTCELDMFMFDKRVNLTSYIYGIILTVLFSIIVNIVTYFALKKINMIESLKSVE